MFGKKEVEVEEAPVADAAVSFSVNPKNNPNPLSIKAVEHALRLGIPEAVARTIAVRHPENSAILLTLK